MREGLDPVAIANEIALLLDVHRGAILIVEGEDDAKLFDRFRATGGACEMFIGFGKENAIEILRLLQGRGLARRTLVVVDADFWHLTGERPDEPHLVCTQFHDLEMDMAMSDALGNVLREWGRAEAISRLEAEEERDIRSILMCRLREVSTIRYANARGGLYLRFRDTEIVPWIDSLSLEVDAAGYISAVLDGSHAAVDRGQVLSAADQVAVDDADLAQLVRGHDFTALLGVALRSVIGECDEAIAARSSVESLLRLSFGRESFERTGLYASIADWEDRTGGVVLA